MSPYNILEAKASALPIIVSDSTGHTDLIKPNYDGLIYKGNDINSAKEKLERLINDIELRKLLGTNARYISDHDESHIHSASKLDVFVNYILNIK